MAVVIAKAGQSPSAHHQVLNNSAFVAFYASLIESLRRKSGESSPQLMG